MSLEEAYRWQDEMVKIMEPAMGGVVGYKTGGHFAPGAGSQHFRLKASGPICWQA